MKLFHHFCIAKMGNSNPQSPALDSAVALSSYRWHELLSGVWLCVVFVAGTTLNGCTLLTFFKNTHLISGSNIYIITLLLNNFMLCILATGMPIVAEFSGHWLKLMDMDACTAYAFIVYLFGLASMFVLVAISVSRYLAVNRPFSANSVNRLSDVCAAIACEVIAAGFAIAPLLGWGSYGLEAHGTSCGLNWRDKSESAVSYLITITIACFAIPVAIMVFCYIRIYHTIRTRHRIRGVMTPTKRRREVELLAVSFTLVLAFLISWIPYTVVSFYVVYGDPETLDPMVSRSAALVAKSQVLWNPILYLYKMKDFRREVVKLFACKCATASLPDTSRFQRTTLAERGLTTEITGSFGRARQVMVSTRHSSTEVETIAMQEMNRNNRGLLTRPSHPVGSPRASIEHRHGQTSSDL